MPETDITRQIWHKAYVDATIGYGVPRAARLLRIATRDVGQLVHFP